MRTLGMEPLTYTASFMPNITGFHAATCEISASGNPSAPSDGAHARGVQVAVLALAEGLLARPDHVDRRAGKFLGDGQDHAHVIAIDAAAEAAADQCLVKMDVLRGHAGFFGGDD